MADYVWDQFITNIKRWFLPPHYLERLEDEFRGARQNAHLVLQFANKVNNLTLQLGKSEANKREQFLFGLDPVL